MSYPARAEGLVNMYIVDLGVMAMKGYLTFTRSIKGVPLHQMQFNVLHGARFLWSGDGVIVTLAPLKGLYLFIIIVTF